MYVHTTPVATTIAAIPTNATRRAAAARIDLTGLLSGLMCGYVAIQVAHSYDGYNAMRVGCLSLNGPISQSRSHGNGYRMAWVDANHASSPTLNRLYH